MGAFHTFYTLLGIIGKRFQDAGLTDLCVESQVISERSVSGVMEGRKYNRAVRLHKLVYKKWVAEKHDEKTSLVDEMFSGLQSLRDNVCKSEFQKKLCENSVVEVAKLFQRYMSFLRCKNGKLSGFWVSYLDLVNILLAMIRASREGDLDLHLSSIRNLVP